MVPIFAARESLEPTILGGIKEYVTIYGATTYNKSRGWVIGSLDLHSYVVLSHKFISKLL